MLLLWLHPSCRWLLAAWGFRAIPLLPLMTLLAMAMAAAVTILGKWLFIGRYKEGDHPLWGAYFIRHWLANQFVTVSIRQTWVLYWGLAQLQGNCREPEVCHPQA